MSRCKSCHAPIVWARSAAGRMIPLDAEEMGGWEAPASFEDGNLAPTGERVPRSDGTTIMVVAVDKAEGKWRSHFASCPDASAHRRRDAKSTPVASR